MFFYIYYGLYLQRYICNWRKLKDGPRFRLAMWKFQVSFAFNCVFFSFVIKLSWDIVLPKFILLSYQKKIILLCIWVLLKLCLLRLSKLKTDVMCGSWSLYWIIYTCMHLCVPCLFILSFLWSYDVRHHQ